MATCPICRLDYESAAFCPRDGARLLGERVLDARYRLIRKVGEGAMGEVFEAEHLNLKRRVAVKILRRHIAYQPEAIARLEREAQAASQLGHPNLVSVLDFGQSDDGSVYLAMEWLEGEDLEQHLARGPVDIGTALDLVSQAAAGVAEAHDHGVIHRDLKPANLFVSHDRAGALRVKVLDFGIAKLAIEQTQLTGTGVLIGTPNYMAPEQALGEPVDARTDVYALGVILYELLTGMVPFRGDSPIAVLHQHTARLPAAPSSVATARGITPELDLVVLRCLAKRPEERFATMHELVASIVAARTGGRPVPPPAPVLPESDDELLAAAGIGRRSPTALIVGLAALGIVAALGVFLVVRGQRAGAIDPPLDASSAALARDASSMALPVDASPVVDVASADAAVAVDTVDAPTADAGADAAPDASAQVDGAWRQRVRARGFDLHASVGPDHPAATVPFELVLELEAPGAVVEAALRRGTLRAEVTVRYFRDHAVVHRSSHVPVRAGPFRTAMTLARAGKHHLAVDLFDGATAVGQARFDLLVAR